MMEKVKVMDRGHKTVLPLERKDIVRRMSRRNEIVAWTDRNGPLSVRDVNQIRLEDLKLAIHENMEQ